MYIVGFLWALRALGMGECKLVSVYIGIVYILPTIGDIFVFCWVYIYIVYIMPTIGEIFVILLGFFGPFGPWVWGNVN